MAIKNYIFDMDGVLLRGSLPIYGAQEMFDRLEAKGLNYAVLTNNPIYTPGDLQHRLSYLGLNVPEEKIYTSAMATAKFISNQNPGCSAFVIGESGLTTALHNAGITITSFDPDYVILGETYNYSYDQITTACTLVSKGCRFVCTNPDNSTPMEDGRLVPAAKALASVVSTATGVEPYYIGKPNPLMMKSVLRFMGAHSGESCMVGDRMDTDIIAGMEAGMETVLVLTGVTTRDMVKKFPYTPTRILDSVADLEK